MPTGHPTPPTLNEICRDAFDKPYRFALLAGPILLGSCIGHMHGVIKEDAILRQQSLEQTQAKAARLWRENAYEVVGFKSYDVVSMGRSITLVLKNPADGRTYEGTALCVKSCAIRKIAAAGG